MGIESLPASLAVECDRDTTWDEFNVLLEQVNKSFASTVPGHLDDEFLQQPEDEIATVRGDLLPDDFMSLHEIQRLA